MARDGVANFVLRMHECEFGPRKVGPDAWESRCPGCRSMDHALSITRNEFNHAVLECRSPKSCQHLRILGAVGWTNEYLYAETSERLISQLRRLAIQPASFGNAEARPVNAAGPVGAARSNGSAAKEAVSRGNIEGDATVTNANGSGSHSATPFHQEEGARVTYYLRVWAGRASRLTLAPAGRGCVTAG